jgi:hypothetical protein
MDDWTLGYSDYDVFYKVIRVHWYIGIKVILSNF